MIGIASTVLIADDDADSRAIVRTILEFQGREVVEAADGGDCLTAVHTCRPDVIVLDLVMPGMDGWDVAAALRADPTTRGIPILALTAAATPLERERALAAGCDRVLQKPIALAELAVIIDELFQDAFPPKPRPAPVARPLFSARGLMLPANRN